MKPDDGQADAAGRVEPTNDKLDPTIDHASSISSAGAAKNLYLDHEMRIRALEAAVFKKSP